jgi:hypothetical protein
VLMWPSNSNIFHIFIFSHFRLLRFCVIFNARKPTNIFKFLTFLF